MKNCLFVKYLESMENSPKFSNINPIILISKNEENLFLYLKRMKAIAPRTATPIAKQIQNMVICKPKISCPRAVAPGDIFTSSQPANAGRDISGKASRIILKIVITRNVLD